MGKIAAIFVLSAVAWSQETSIQGPLAGLPGKAGPTIERIQSAAEGAWLELGPPAPDPKWGRARGRSWTSVMPFAPELGGAFLFGEGIHGYTKPDGHPGFGRYTDIWALRGGRWLCVAAHVTRG